VNPDGFAWVDPGLGGFLERTGYGDGVWMPELGKHKVPTLRNVARVPTEGFVKAYGHNGYFKSLDAIVHLHNTRDVEPWPTPEFPDTMNADELGNLGLTAAEEHAVVAFVRTLSDGWTPPSP
jgi:cytochrome c peroxidase